MKFICKACKTPCILDVGIPVIFKLNGPCQFTTKETEWEIYEASQ